MKTTYYELQNFTNSASRWTQMVAKDKPTKLSYAVAKMLKRSEKHSRNYGELLEDARLELALTDEKTKAVFQPYQFDKVGLKRLTEERRKLDDTEIEIEPYFATELPPDLSNDVFVAFEGFCIKPDEPV